MNREEYAAWEARIEERAHKMWAAAGSPEGALDEYREKAKELVALEEVPDAGTRPVADPSDPDAEPLLAVENQGDFPGLADQGDESPHPRRPNERRDP